MRALITGAGYRGIGGATALRLARDAASRGQAARLAICSTGRRDDHAPLLKELRDAGAEVLTLTGDLTDPEVPARLVAAAVEFCGGLDALVSNAGVGKPKTLLSLAVDDWDFQMNLHARAAWLLARAAHAALKASHGSIVATASMAGTVPYAGNGAYPIAKAALIMVCQTLAQEWASDGIRVNVVSPGPVRSKLTEKYYADPAVAAVRRAVIPLGRVGEPEEISGVIAFLLGPDATFMTGQNILVDGGLVGSSLNQLARRTV
jgi:glucose 1-dehydrogenase